MGPASTSYRALHGWTLEASSCSSCQVGTRVVRVLSWVKPCSTSLDLRVVCAFWKKFIHLGVAPEPLAIWNKELEDLVLKLLWFNVCRWKRTRIWLVPGSFCCKVLKWSALKKSFLWCALFWRKSALTECSPRASCYLEQRVGGSWIWVVQRTENFPWCSPWAFFKKNLPELFL